MRNEYTVSKLTAGASISIVVWFIALTLGILFG